MTQATSRMISLPRYSIDRRISVVITRHDALGLIVTSPVIRPTSPNSAANSRYFWFESALIGLVYTTRCPSRSACAIAYSATIVLPADVCADTSTLSPRSMQCTDVRWNGSSSNGHARAGGSRGLCCDSGTYAYPGGTATWWRTECDSWSGAPSASPSAAGACPSGFSPSALVGGALSPLSASACAGTWRIASAVNSSVTSAGAGAARAFFLSFFVPASAAGRPLPSSGTSGARRAAALCSASLRFTMPVLAGMSVRQPPPFFCAC